MSDVNSNFDKMDSLFFTTSNKGQRLLVINEQIYRCNKKTSNKKYWVCVVSGCSISVHTDKNDMYLCGGKIDHDHEPNSDLIRTICLRQKMKERVLKELTPIHVIYEEETAKDALNERTVATYPMNQEICEYRLIRLYY